MRRILFALAASAVAAAGASAQSRPLVAPIVPCQPVVIPPGCAPGTIIPGLSGQPGTPTQPGEVPNVPNIPNVPDAPPQSTPDVSSAFARPGEGGTQAAATGAPNMFGDLLGARSLRVLYTANATVAAPTGAAQTLADGSQGFLVLPNNGTIQFRDTTGTRPVVPISSSQNLNYVQPFAGGGVDTFYAQQVVQSLLSTGGLTAEQIAQFNRLTPQQQAQVLANRGAINQTITRTLRGITVPNVTVTSVTAAGGPNGLVTYDIAAQAEALVPLPGSSSGVGRIKASEDTSPLPRDRVFFNYDYFDSVPFTTYGMQVNRFQAGVEKTFLDGRWSFEFRLPFASTLASTTVQGFEGTNTELGNVRMTLKRIFSQSERLTTTSGVAVTLPTAPDQVALSALDGRELYRFRNQSVTVEPYIAALYTPNDRFFAQAWSSVNFDTSGGELTWDPAVFGGSGNQRIWDLPILAVDAQIGYWLLRRDTGTLRGLAPFIELHWNHVIAQGTLSDEINNNTQSNALSATTTGNDELNLIAGFNTQWGDNLFVALGASAPLLQRPDRTFDAQFGVRVNYLYGRTARARNPIYGIGTY